MASHRAPDLGESFMKSLIVSWNVIGATLSVTLQEHPQAPLRIVPG